LGRTWFDSDGSVASWNVGAQRINGYGTDEILGRNFSCFYSEEDRKRGKPAQDLEIAAREGRYAEEGWRVRKDGSRRLANVLITAQRNERGDLRGFAMITRDMTQRRLEEEERERLLIEAQRLNRMKDEFLSTVSHVPPTPATRIGGARSRPASSCTWSSLWSL
jgi:PAS domain S-box-containing protein